MDTNLLIVYALLAVISLCLFLLVALFGSLIIFLSSRNIERSKHYLKNIIYSIFGGVIAIILLELKGTLIDLNFFTIHLPLNLLTIFIFVIMGLVYIALLDKFFIFLEKLKKKTNKGKAIYRSKDKEYIMNKKVKFLIRLIVFLVIGLTASGYLATLFGEIANAQSVGFIIQVSVFLAGFGFLIMTHSDKPISSPFSVFSPNTKEITGWSLWSIVLAFCYFIFPMDPWNKMFAILSAGFMFFTITLVMILTIFHDNRYMKAFESKNE